MIDLLPFSVVLGTSLWVLMDSRNLGIKKGATRGFFNMGPTGWFLSCLLCWIAAFPLYLIKRRAHTRAAAATVPADDTSGTDWVAQGGALRDLSAQGLLTAEEYQTRRLALVARVLERASHGDSISQLATLADLSTQHLLTDDEFMEKKKTLVRRMIEQPSQGEG